MSVVDLGRAFPVSHGDWVSGGGTEIRTSALFNPETKLVHDIETVEGVDEDGEEVEILDREYIELESGEIIEASGFILEF